MSSLQHWSRKVISQRQVERSITILTEWLAENEPPLNDPPNNVQMSDWVRWSNQVKAISGIARVVDPEVKYGLEQTE